MEQGDFQELVRQYRDRVYSFAFYSLKNREDAEDVTQEVLIRLWNHWRRLEGEHLKAWLLRVTRNACIDRSRSLSRRQEMSLNRPMNDDGDGQGASFMDQLPDNTSSDGAGQTLRAEFRTRLQAALDELPEEQREVFVMREFGGLKFREIAAATKVSENTVKSRMRYALEALRGHLAEYREHSFDREEDAEKASAKSGII